MRKIHYIFYSISAMVCVPCIVIPFFLFIWHRYLQPIVLKFWNPWKTIEEKTGKTAEQDKSNNVCPLAEVKKKEENISNSDSVEEKKTQ